MEQILDEYVEIMFGNEAQATFKLKQFENNYKKYAPENLGVSVLDIGIGRGEMLSCYKNWGYKNYFGIDISKSTIKHCQSLDLNCQLVNNTREWLENNPNVFDMVTMFDVIEHFKKDDVIPTLTAIKNSLRENGVLIIQTPNLQAIDPQLHRYNDFTHEFGYTENSLREVLCAAGFAKINFEGFEEDIYGGFNAWKCNFFRNLIWKFARFKREMTGNINPRVLHPVFYAVVVK